MPTPGCFCIADYLLQVSFDTGHVRFVGSVAVEGAVVRVIVEEAISLPRVEGRDDGVY